VQLGTVY